MTRTILSLLVLATGCFAATPVPEIDATSATSAITLIAGGLMMVRSGRK